MNLKLPVAVSATVHLLLSRTLGPDMSLLVEDPLELPYYFTTVAYAARDTVQLALVF